MSILTELMANWPLPLFGPFQCNVGRPLPLLVRARFHVLGDGLLDSRTMESLNGFSSGLLKQDFFLFCRADLFPVSLFLFRDPTET